MYVYIAYLKPYYLYRTILVGTKIAPVTVKINVNGAIITSCNNSGALYMYIPHMHCTSIRRMAALAYRSLYTMMTLTFIVYQAQACAVETAHDNDR